jgi:hypothetical protein
MRTEYDRKNGLALLLVGFRLFGRAEGAVLAGRSCVFFLIEMQYARRVRAKPM